jgi:hypothetical protein
MSRTNKGGTAKFAIQGTGAGSLPGLLPFSAEKKKKNREQGVWCSANRDGSKCQ